MNELSNDIDVIELLKNNELTIDIDKIQENIKTIMQKARDYEKRVSAPCEIRYTLVSSQKTNDEKAEVTYGVGIVANGVQIAEVCDITSNHDEALIVLEWCSDEEANHRELKILINEMLEQGFI